MEPLFDTFHGAKSKYGDIDIPRLPLALERRCREGAMSHSL